MALRLVQGGGSDPGGPAYSEAKTLAKHLLTILVDQRTNLVRISDLPQLDAKLVGLGFRRLKREERNPPGYQLFYRSGRVLVRIKTKGDEFGRRKDRAAMSVSLTHRNGGTEWDEEYAKFNGSGEIEPKSLRAGGGGNISPFTVLIGGAEDRDHTGLGDDWANRTHLHFNVEYLPGGESLPF